MTRERCANRCVIRGMRAYLSLGCKSVAHCLAQSKSGIDRLTQSRVAEWLKQTLHGTLLSRRGRTVSSR